MTGRSLEQRLAHYSAPPDANGCVLWTGSIMRTGYGRIIWGRRNKLAHRLAWIVARGEIPDGMNVCHKCDVRSCVNVEHMFLGTQADNVTDMIIKGRRHSSKGVANLVAKLTPEQARAIRADARLQREIAAAYGITQASVSAVKRRQTWAHIDA